MSGCNPNKEEALLVPGSHQAVQVLILSEQLEMPTTENSSSGNNLTAAKEDDREKSAVINLGKGSNDGKKTRKQAKSWKRRRVYCNLCDYFTDNKDLDRHKKKHRWNEKFRCPRCTFCAKRQRDIDRHLKRDHNKHGASVAVSSMVQQPNSAKEMNEISGPHQQETAIEISGSSVDLSKDDNNVLSKRRKIDDENPSRNTAQKKESNLVVLEDVGGGKTVAQETMPSARRYCCDSCGYSSLYKILVEKHHKMHSRNEKYCCLLCTYSSKKQCIIDKHLKRDHKDGAALLLATKQPQLPSNGNPEMPMENWAGYVCDSCDHSAFDAPSLKWHKKMHNRNEKFRCPRCTYSSMRECTVVKHLRNDHKGTEVNSMALGPISVARRFPPLAYILPKQNNGILLGIHPEQPQVSTSSSGDRSVVKRKRVKRKRGMKAVDFEKDPDPLGNITNGKVAPHCGLAFRKETEIPAGKGKSSIIGYISEKKSEITEKKKVALEEEEVSAITLLGLMFRTHELGLALELPGCTEETRKAHAEAQKMVELVMAEVTRRDAEIVSLEEEEKAFDDALEVLMDI